MSWVPEELIRIKAHEIREKRQSKEGRDGILENDWNQASNKY